MPLADSDELVGMTAEHVTRRMPPYRSFFHPSTGAVELPRAPRLGPTPSVSRRVQMLPHLRPGSCCAPTAGLDRSPRCRLCLHHGCREHSSAGPKDQLQQTTRVDAEPGHGTTVSEIGVEHFTRVLAFRNAELLERKNSRGAANWQAPQSNGLWHRPSNLT